MLDRDHTQMFEDARPALLGLAYRILGSLADAEDAVQDTFIRWAKTDREVIEKPASWLTTTCTRCCLDQLRSAHRSRVNYVGAWLPEPIQTPTEADAITGFDLASSLTTAFLLTLERLTPKERAAYLLHDIFDVSYPETAETLGIQESACRKLVSRAKANIGRDRIRHIAPVERQDQLLAAFKAAITSGSSEQLAPLLSDDIRLSADGGGKVPAILDVLHGRDEVIAFVSESLREYWASYQWSFVNINSARGVVLKRDGVTEATASFAYDDTGRATDIYIVRNPDKLGCLGTVAVH